MGNIHWYELCFFGDENPESEKYDPDRACSYVIKTEIPPVIKDETALEILFGDDPKEEWMKELLDNLTCVMEVTEDEARLFDVDDLTKRVEDPKLGVYYVRKTEG